MTRFSRLLKTALVIVMGAITSAHYGSRDIVYEGMAGPYRVAVYIRPPTVIPGQAEIVVDVEGDNPARVTVQPIVWGLGESSAPAPDSLLREPGSNPRFSGRLWLMTLGTYRVQVSIEGDRGRGGTTIPVPAIVLGKPPSGAASLMFGLLGVALILGTVLVVMGIARDGSRDPERAASTLDRHRGTRAARVSALVCLSLAGFIGVLWQRASDGFQRMIFQPYAWNVSQVGDSGHRELRIRLNDPRWNRAVARPLPDHGYAVHLFLIRTPDLDVLAHLHPVAIDSIEFRTMLPPLKAGTYRVFGEVVHSDGVSETLVDTLVLAESRGDSWQPASPDDSWWMGSGTDTPSLVQWSDPGPGIKPGNRETLTFSVGDSSGAVPYQLFMGMEGHAIVVREDLSVFAHLHPMGTVSMAAMEIGAGPGSTTELTATMHAMPVAGLTAPVQFPWVFPTGGRYRIWGQTRVGGHIMTGTLDLKVEESP